jgi:hypothetical protein
MFPREHFHRIFSRASLSLLLFFLSSLASFAQKEKEVKDFHLRKNIREAGLQYQFTVLDEDRHGVWFYHRHKRYHWFKAQRILSTEGASAGILLHGNFEAFYSHKQLAIRGRFCKGLKSGEWKEWYEDGSLKAVERWAGGRQRGEQMYYNADGSVREVIQARQWSQTTFRNDSLITQHGKKTEIRVYDGQARIASITRTKNGVLHGDQLRYEDGRKVESLHYKNGSLVEPKTKKEGKAQTAEEQGEEKESFFKRLFRKKDKAEKDAEKEKKETEPKEKTEKSSRKDKPSKEKPAKDKPAKDKQKNNTDPKP